MKRLLPALILLPLLLSACFPQVAPTASADVLATSVAQTLTALPSQTEIVRLVTPIVNTPTAGLPTITSPALVPTNTQAPLPTQVIHPPTAVPYVPPAPVWSPTYADQFIHYYYQRINARDYTTTWSLLTDAFKAAVNSEVSGGYAGYVNFWNTVLRVDIYNATVASWTGSNATVVVNMAYNYMNGYVNSSNQTFHLFYDSGRGTWMFDSAAASPLPTAIPTPVSIPAYPADFIYYYFNNINLRNYALTWSLLAPSFIANNNPPSEGGYTGYVDYWNSVARVDVTYIIVNSNSGGYAEVVVGLVYNYVSSLVTTGNPHFHLAYNYGIGNWQFSSP